MCGGKEGRLRKKKCVIYFWIDGKASELTIEARDYGIMRASLMIGQIQSVSYFFREFIPVINI